MRTRSASARAALAALACAALGAAGGPALGQSAPAVVATGAVAGTAFVPRAPGRTWEPTEDVAVLYDVPVDKGSFEAALSIEPAAPHTLYTRDYGKRVEITFRKVAGSTYRLRVGPGVRALGGGETGAPLDLTVRVADLPVPAPARATPGEPYRYGILAHPFPASLGGPGAARQIALFAQAGVRFVRIDYCGTQIEPAPGRFDWALTDRIADGLAAEGITELPIVEQYCAPGWATGGRGYPAIWSDPRSYAAFAGAVAQHVARRHPRIARLELFNEPNLHGWWKNEADPRYAATDGSATAAYMQAAYAAVKRAAPRLTVVGPALADGGRMVDPRTFFTTMYDRGCRRGTCWDVLSVHTYRWKNPTFAAPEGAPNRFDIYKTLQHIAARHGDEGVHVMLTEWGYSTDEASPDAVDPRTQARYLALGFNAMLADPTVDGIVYVSMLDPGDGFWADTALVSRDGVPKPAFAVYRAFARGASSAARTAPSSAARKRSSENASAR